MSDRNHRFFLPRPSRPGGAPVVLRPQNGVAVLQGRLELLCLGGGEGEAVHRLVSQGLVDVHQIPLLSRRLSVSVDHVVGQIAHVGEAGLSRPRVLGELQLQHRRGAGLQVLLVGDEVAQGVAHKSLPLTEMVS